MLGVSRRRYIGSIRAAWVGTESIGKFYRNCVRRNCDEFCIRHRLRSRADVAEFHAKVADDNSCRLRGRLYRRVERILQRESKLQTTAPSGRYVDGRRHDARWRRFTVPGE